MHNNNNNKNLGKGRERKIAKKGIRTCFSNLIINTNDMIRGRIINKGIKERRNENRYINRTLVAKKKEKTERVVGRRIGEGDGAT